MPSDDPKDVLSDAYHKIQSLIAENRWQEAHRACLEVLQFDPDNIKIIRLKNKIEKKVKKINRQAIKEDLKNLEPLWRQGQYEEYLIHLKELSPYSHDYPPLRKIILKAQNTYRQQLRQRQEAYYKTELTAIRTMLEREEFQEALRKAQKLRIVNVMEKELKQFISHIRSQWIDTELKKSKALFETQKYEDMLLFCQNLLRIDSSSKKLKKLIKTTKAQYLFFRIEEKRDFIYEGLEKMKTLYQLKKHQRTMEAASEILNIDPNNQDAQKFYAKAKKKIARESNKELFLQIKTAQQQLRQLYRQSPKKFVKI